MEKDSIKAYYKERLKAEKIAYKALKRKHLSVSWLRLADFILGVFLCWMVWGNWQLVLLAFLMMVVVFGFLLKWSVRLELQLRLKKHLLEVNQNEIAALNYDYSAFDDGLSYAIPEHEYTYDLDFFGKKSLFQKIERCGTEAGKRELAQWLSFPDFDKERVLDKQRSVQELMEDVAWRQEYNATGKIIGLTEQEELELKNWLQTPIQMFNRPFFDVLLIVVPIFTLGALGIYLFDFITLNIFLLLLSVPLMFVLSYFKRVNQMMASSEKRFAILKTYSRLFEMIESREMKTSFLKDLQSNLSSDSRKSSVEILALGKIFEAFEYRNNMLVGVMLNAFFMWDIRQVRNFEKWQQKNLKFIEQWMSITSKMDAMSSLANLAKNHAEYTFPVFSEKEYCYKFENMGHPMIPEGVRVNNSYSIDSLGSFSIVTGANMAGKSTFLRTIGANLALAMTGAPVCASYYEFEPIQLFSSMRTSDSLSDQESYFFSELKRLKQIIDTLEGGKKLFIILDEILKGTNSKDKAEGSKKFMEKLMKTESLGVIATHDLSLCSLEGEFPEKINNYSFEVGFKGDDLSFDYKLRSGVCQNMNASFLLEKMGLVDVE